MTSCLLAWAKKTFPNKASTIKGKNLLPSGKFVPLKVEYHSELREPKLKKAELLPLKVYPFSLTPFALRKAKIVCNFGLSECNRVKHYG